MPEETPQNWKRILSNVVNHTITNHYRRDPRQVRSSWDTLHEEISTSHTAHQHCPQMKNIFIYPTNLISFLVDDDNNFTSIKVFWFISA